MKGGAVPAGHREPVVWTESLYQHPEQVADRVVRCAPDAPLMRIAFLWQSGAAALEFTGALAGGHAAALWDEIGSWQRDAAPSDARADPYMLVNACTPGGFTRAAQLGARGAGLVRGEFLFAIAAAALLRHPLPDGTTVGRSIVEGGEFATLERLLADPASRRALDEQFTRILDGAAAAFPPDSLVFVRLFDFGEAYLADGGPRGIRLLLERLPESVVFLARVLDRTGARAGVRFVLAPPMVSSYAELEATVELVRRDGIELGSAVNFGWEVETPAAALCTGLWADHLRREHDVRPSACGIGTNDLTQFTLARSRRTAGPVPAARPEAHPAVLALLGRLADDCRSRQIPAVLSGAAGEDTAYRGFARDLGLLVSCPVPALLNPAGHGPDAIAAGSAAADGLPGHAGIAEMIVGGGAR